MLVLTGASRGGDSLAAMQGDAALARVLLQATEEADAPADVNALDKQGRSPLVCATLDGHEAVVSALLLAGADPSRADAR